MDDRRKLEIAGWALAAFVVVLLAARFLHHSESQPAPLSVGGAGASSTAPAHAPRAVPKLIVVDVEGEVARPGIQRVPDGSRAAGAVDQAGGLTRRGDATAVNLAAPLHDGQQVVVPRRGATGAVAAAPPGAADPAAGGGGAGQQISLSTATVAQLD